MKILLDENMPESLLGALENLGHKVDSVNHLKLKGLDNGTLYRQVAIAYDLCFTRDAGFARNALRRVCRNHSDSALELLMRLL